MVTAYGDKLERVLSRGTGVTPSGLLPRLRGTYTRALFFIRSAGEVAENSAARRMAYAKKFSIEL